MKRPGRPLKTAKPINVSPPDYTVLLKMIEYEIVLP